MDNSNNLRESVSILKTLAKKSMGELNGLALAHGIAIRSFDESITTFVRRLYEGLTRRSDFDLAYSALSLVQSLTDEPFRRDPASEMRARVQQTVQSNLEEIKREDVKVDREFMKALKCL